MKESYTPKIEQETKIESSPIIHTPYCEATLEAFSKKFPQKIEGMKTVLDEIDNQSVENFSVFKSENMPGVSFSYSKITVTPELIKKLSKIKTPDNMKEEIIFDQEKEQGQEEKTNAKKQDYFLFTAFSLPPGGSAFTVEDVAIDRYIRLLPRISGAIKRGEKIPEINLYLLGAPTGFGGSVTKEWTEGVKEKGCDQHGELYAEFIKQKEPENQEDVHIVLQGVSKGAVVAEKTSKYLPEKLQDVTQRLLDNPAGDHQSNKISTWFKGAQVATGLAVESISRMLLDDTMKILMKKDAEFMDKLSKKTGIAKDTEEQGKLKFDAAIAEGKALLRGSPRDENTRSFIRRGMYDPLTFRVKKLVDIWKKKREGVDVPMFQKGKSLEVPFKGYHFFLYNRHERWAKILDSVEKTNNLK